MDPYRGGTFPSWQEEELWFRLDEALWMALRQPYQAYTIAWGVWTDSRGFPEVRQAACDLMSQLMPPFYDES